MRVKELRDRLRGLSKQMHELNGLAENEDRGFTADEQEKWNKLLSDFDDTESRIERAERIESLDAIADKETRRRLPHFDDDGEIDDTNGEALGESRSKEDRQKAREQMTAAELRATDEYEETYMRWLREGEISKDERRELNRAKSDMGNFSTRAQAIATDAAGGFTVPEGFAGFVTETMQDFSGILGAVGSNRGPTMLRTASGNLIPFPTNDDTGNAGTILAENAAVPEQDTVFGSRNLTAYMYTSRLIRVSLQLIQDEAVNLQAYLGNILGKRLGRAVSPHLAAGSGTGEPTGLVTAALDGGVNISAGGGLTYADLLDLEHALDPAYRRRGAMWAFNDATLRAIKGLVDGNNRPLWLPGDSGSLADQPAGPTINGYGYVVDQGLPNIGVGNRPIAFGDMSEYYIREVLGVTLFTFRERYMDNLQLGFMGYARWDGNLIDTNAVVTDVVVA